MNGLEKDARSHILHLHPLINTFVEGKHLTSTGKCPPRSRRIMLGVYDLISGEWLYECGKCDDVGTLEPDLNDFRPVDQARPHWMISWCVVNADL